MILGSHGEVNVKFNFIKLVKDSSCFTRCVGSETHVAICVALHSFLLLMRGFGGRVIDG